MSKQQWGPQLPAGCLFESGNPLSFRHLERSAEGVPTVLGFHLSQGVEVISFGPVIWRLLFFGTPTKRWVSFWFPFKTTPKGVSSKSDERRGRHKIAIFPSFPFKDRHQKGPPKKTTQFFASESGQSKPLNWNVQHIKWVLLWMDEILHHLRNPGMMILL